jgi:hypothetical protein
MVVIGFFFFWIVLNGGGTIILSTTIYSPWSSNLYCIVCCWKFTEVYYLVTVPQCSSNSCLKQKFWKKKIGHVIAFSISDRTLHQNFVSTLEPKILPHATVIAKGISMLYVVKARGFLYIPMARIRGNYNNGFLTSRITSPYLCIMPVLEFVSVLSVFAFHPVHFTDLYITSIKTPLYCTGCGKLTSFFLCIYSYNSYSFFIWIYSYNSYSFFEYIHIPFLYEYIHIKKEVSLPHLYFTDTFFSLIYEVFGSNL